MSQIPNNYYGILSRIESNNAPYIKAKSSSASGLYQFTKATWTALGGSWGSNSSLAFGGLRPSADQQMQMVQRLTQDNARMLSSRNIPVNSSTLYAMHFLGSTQGLKALGAINSPNKQISDYVSASAINANPSILRNKTVGDFMAWLENKTGAKVNNPFALAPATDRGGGIWGSNGFDFNDLTIYGFAKNFIENGQVLAEAAPKAITDEIISKLADPAKRVAFVVLGVILIGISVFVVLKGPQAVAVAAETYVTKGKNLMAKGAMEAIA